MRRFYARFLRDESGATAIEYGLLCALIFLAIVAPIMALANTNNGGFTQTVDRLTAAIQAVLGA